MNKTSVRATGIPWFAREDYPRILAIMKDADTLPPTYEGWLRRAEEVERRLMNSGHVVIRAVVNPDEFPAWCVGNGLDVDSTGRSQFAAWIAYQQVNETH